MRKIVLMLSVSLDGFFEGPNHELDWQLVDDEWNTIVVRDVVPAEVMELKAQPGGDLALGGAGLASAFMRFDLIDEYRLYVHPVLIGRGRRLFEPSDVKADLRLAETRAFGSGVVLLRYERAHGEEPG